MLTTDDMNQIKNAFKMEFEASKSAAAKRSNIDLGAAVADLNDTITTLSATVATVQSDLATLRSDFDAYVAAHP